MELAIVPASDLREAMNDLSAIRSGISATSGYIDDMARAKARIAGALEFNAEPSGLGDLNFLRLEAENMALSLESAGYGRHFGGKMCTPLERYRAKYPRRQTGGTKPEDTK